MNRSHIVCVRAEPAHQGPGGGAGAHAHQGQERRHGRGARQEGRRTDQGMSMFLKSIEVKTGNTALIYERK